MPVGQLPAGARVIGIDGRGASGKSTLADRLARVHGAATVVHTDDIAWHHSIFDWAQQLLEGVLSPYLAGEPVNYRPPGWEKKGRPGQISVPADTTLLIIEGTGTGRAELRPHLDTLLWLQADDRIARERGIARDLTSGVNGSTRAAAEGFWDDWMREEIPFLEQHQPWHHADAVICGTPESPVPEGEVLVARDR